MMTAFEKAITAALCRSQCPDPTELGEYHLGMVPTARSAPIAEHLKRCPYCAHELAQLDRFMDDLAPELDYSLAERVKFLVARLRPRGLGLGGLPAPALALRGEAMPLLTYDAGDAQITLQVQVSPQQPDSFDLLGLLLGLDTTGLKATLWQGDEQQGTAGVDELGNFVLAGLRAGSYQVMLRGSDVEILIEDLQVGPAAADAASAPGP